MQLRHASAAVAALFIAFGADLASAQTTGAIELRTMAEKEIRLGDEVRRVPAGKVVPGDRVVYTIVARNVSDQAAERIVITDPIPTHMTYVEGSATPLEGDVFFSIDGGMRFDRPERLEVIEADGTARPAEARDYTHVRFVFDHVLPPASERAVHFAAQLD